MRLKTSNIVFLLMLSAFAFPHAIQAQEGEILNEKAETSEIIAKDSLLSNGELNAGELRDQSDALPIGPMPQFNFSKLPAPESTIQKEEKKPALNSGEKVKPDDQQSKLNFNFLYYLFYKFNVVDSTDGQVKQ